MFEAKNKYVPTESNNTIGITISRILYLLKKEGAGLTGCCTGAGAWGIVGWLTSSIYSVFHMGLCKSSNRRVFICNIYLYLSIFTILLLPSIVDIETVVFE